MRMLTKPMSKTSRCLGAIVIGALTASGAVPVLPSPSGMPWGLSAAHATSIIEAGNMGSCYQTCDDVVELVAKTTGKEVPGCNSSGNVSAAQAQEQMLAFTGSGVLSGAQAWCAKHGDSNFTNMGLAVSQESDADKTAEAPEGVSCSIALTQQDVSLFGGGDYAAACEMVGRMKASCATLANSEVFYQCLAFKMTAPVLEGDETSKCRYGQAHELQGLFIVLDAAAAISCATACAVPAASGACLGLGTVASVAEIAGTFAFQANNDITQWAAGVGGVASGAITAGLSIAGGYNKGLDEVGAKAGAKAGEKSAGQVLACVQSAIYAALGIARTVALSDLTKTSDKACKSIQELTGTGTGGSTGSSGSSSSSGWAGSSSGTSSGSSSTGSGGGTSGGSDKVAALQACINGGGDAASCAEQAGFYGDASAATGKDMALMKTAGTRPAGMDLKSLMDSIKQNGFGNTLAAAGNGQPPEVAAALGSLGAAAEKGGLEFAKANGFAATSPVLASVTGGRGAGGGGGGGASNPFANMFGAGAQGAPGLAGAKSMGFGGERDLAAETDIWHANTDKNLFQIVSSRIEKVAPRVIDSAR